MTVFGRYGKLTAEIYYPSYAENQNCELFAVPVTGKMTRLGAWLAISTFAGWDGTHMPATRLCVWNSSGVLLAYSDQFWPSSASLVRYEMDLLSQLSVAAGQYVYIGFWTYKAYDIGVSFGSATGSTHYWSGNTGTGPTNISSGVGHDNYQVNAYAYVTPGASGKVRRSGAWSAVSAKVRRSGGWATPSGVHVRRGGSWVTL